jgi:uncharacterized membrane protein
VLYVVAWLLVPAGGRDDSLLDQAIHRIPGRWSRLAVIGLVVVLLVIVIQSVPVVGYPNGDPYPWGSGFYLDPGLFWAVVVIALGIVVLRRHDAAPAAPTAEARSEAPSIVQSEPRPASPLGWYVIAAVLLGVGGALAGR